MPGLGATPFAQTALWRVVDEIADTVGTLADPDAEALRGPSENIHRLRDLHASCAPHERELRFAHLALLTEHHLYADKLLRIRRYCAVRLADTSLPREERTFLASLEQLTARLDTGPDLGSPDRDDGSAS